MKDYFAFDKAERKGVLSLLIIILCLYFFPSLYGKIYPHTSEEFKSMPLSGDIVPLETLADNQDYGYSNRSYEKNNESESEQPTTVSLFPFNPNTCSLDDFLKLGLPPRTAHSILNFREKGGKFYKPEDLKKIYTLEESDYTRLKDFIKTDESAGGSFENNTEKSTPAESFPFNPNTATLQDFQRLGLTEKTAQTIVNFREKGGKFYKPEDFKKIYSLAEADYNRLLPFISTTDANAAKGTTNPQASKKYAGYTVATLNINNAPLAEWQMLPGVGMTYASRIIKFREALGGFVSIDQVGETFALPDSVFLKMKPFLLYNSFGIRKININTATLEEIDAHPYLNKSHAKDIIYYREKTGKFTKIEQLQLLRSFDDGKNIFQKVKPYLTVDN